MSQAWLQCSVWVRIQNVARKSKLGLENMCERISDLDTHLSHLGSLVIFFLLIYLFLTIPPEKWVQWP